MNNLDITSNSDLNEKNQKLLQDMERIREDWVDEMNKLKVVIKKVTEEKREFEQQKQDLIKKNNMLKSATENSQLNKNNDEEENNSQQNDIYEEIKENSADKEVPINKNKEPEKSQFNKRDAAGSPQKDRESDDSSLFDRADDSQDILDSHLGRNEREQIQDLLSKVKQQPPDKEHYNNVSGSDSDLERELDEDEDNEEDPKIQFPKVHAVKKEEVIPQAAKILKYWQENGVDIMEVQNVLFSNFSLTRKVSVVSLKKVLIDKFLFDSEEATLLARYMVEVPEQYKTENDEDSDKVEYRFDPDRQLSHAKVVSRLQLLMSTIADD